MTPLESILLAMGEKAAANIVDETLRQLIAYAGHEHVRARVDYIGLGLAEADAEINAKFPPDTVPPTKP